MRNIDSRNKTNIEDTATPCSNCLGTYTKLLSCRLAEKQSGGAVFVHAQTMACQLLERYESFTWEMASNIDV